MIPSDPTQFALGYNATGAEAGYQTSGSIMIDLMRAATPVYATTAFPEDSDGYPTIPNGQSAEWLVLYDLGTTEGMDGVAGTYTIECPAGLTPTFDGNMVSSITAAGSGKWTVVLATPAMPAGYFSKRGLWFNWHLHIRVVNNSGAPIKATIAVYRQSHATARAAGKLFSPEFVAMMQTASGGYIRTMDLTETNTAWCESIAEIPTPRKIGRQTQQYRIEYPYTKTAKGHNSAARLSPEELGILALETGRPLWVNTVCTMGPAVLAEYFSRLLSTYPAGMKVAVESNNEPWNYAFLQVNVLRYVYGDLPHGTGDKDTWGVGTNPTAAIRNCGRHSILTWDAAEAAFGRSRVVRMVNVQVDWYDGGGKPQLKITNSAGVPVWQLADHICQAPYWNGSEQGPIRADVLTRNYAGLAARQKANITRKATINYENWRSQAAGDGVTRVPTFIYEFWTHNFWSYGYINPTRYIEATGQTVADFPGQMMTAVTANRLTPTTANGYTHAGEPLATCWADGEVALVSMAGGPLTGDMILLVRVKPDGLAVYNTQAAYDSDAPMTIPQGTSVLLLALQRVGEYLEADLDVCINNTDGVLDHAIASFKAAGYQGGCIFKAVGNWSPLVSRPGNGMAPWAVKRGSQHSPVTPAETWIKSYV